MKKAIVILLLIGATTVQAQSRPDRYDRDRPPVTVQRSFEREYRNSNNVTWSQNNGRWHATYMDNNRNVEAYYDRNGRRLATHRDLDRNEIPRNLDNRINRMYHPNGDYRVRRIERPGQTSLFEVLINGVTMYLDEQGRKRAYSPRY